MSPDTEITDTQITQSDDAMTNGARDGIRPADGPLTVTRIEIHA